ncbi:MAG: hypothetical protein KIT22_11500 [Verrucomicrobiae bacterium]|nr:hypothetical protein [Verrucomicrobiae bacterium]
MSARRGHLADTLWRIGLGLALLPWCVGATWALGLVIRNSGSAAYFWVAFLGGAAGWLVIFLLLPKPMWLYVVGHELTHAVWTWLFGGRVKSLRATSRGGHVVVTRTNTLIVLAPYFFPLYAVLWAVIWGLAAWLLDARGLRPWFHFGLGLTYAFHVTLTVHILRIRQPDIHAEGWFLSAVVIWLGNVLVLLLTLPPLTGRVGLTGALGWMVDRTGRFLAWLASPLG